MLKTEGITHVDVWQEGDGIECYDEEERKEEQEIEFKGERLNADYIKKYLGELTPLQESRLLLMRRKLEDFNLEKVSCEVFMFKRHW